MWNLLHSLLHTHGTGGFVPAARPASASAFHPAHPWQPRQEAGNIIDYDPPHRHNTFRPQPPLPPRPPPATRPRKGKTSLTSPPPPALAFSPPPRARPAGRLPANKN